MDLRSVEAVLGLSYNTMPGVHFPFPTQHCAHVFCKTSLAKKINKVRLKNTRRFIIRFTKRAPLPIVSEMKIAVWKVASDITKFTSE